MSPLAVIIVIVVAPPALLLVVALCRAASATPPHAPPGRRLELVRRLPSQPTTTEGTNSIAFPRDQLTKGGRTCGAP